jgi:hypothetical protein
MPGQTKGSENCEKSDFGIYGESGNQDCKLESMGYSKKNGKK